MKLYYCILFCFQTSVLWSYHVNRLVNQKLSSSASTSTHILLLIPNNIFDQPREPNLNTSASSLAVLLLMGINPIPSSSRLILQDQMLNSMRQQTSGVLRPFQYLHTLDVPLVRRNLVTKASEHQYHPSFIILSGSYTGFDIAKHNYSAI